MTSSSPDISPDIDGLVAELIELLGEDGVSTDRATRERASVDGCRMSPIITAKLPLGLADVIAYPRSAEEIGLVVAAAHRHGVPLTARGKGTANYGQGLPMSDGLVLDTTRARAIVEIGDGWVTAEAGAVIATIENAVRASGQELWMYPSTAQSTIAGFLAGGSGGTGSVEHGSISSGAFVRALDVVYADGDPRLVHVEGEDAAVFLHTYGTAGVIARATVALEPLQEWRALYASFGDHHAAAALMIPFGRREPSPRLVSTDPAEIANTLPSSAGIPRDRASFRAILRSDEIAWATEQIERAGGTVETVLDAPAEVIRMSMLSYNHAIEWLMKAYPGRYFHLELVGNALVERLDDVQAVYPGGLLHLEAQKDRPLGLLAAEYESEEAVYAAFAAFEGMGLFVHNPHQWLVDHQVARTRALKARTDPRSILNPGKMPDTDVVNAVMG